MEENTIIYWVYKKNHPLTPQDILNVFDLGYLGVEKDFNEQKSYISNRKKRNQVVTRRKRVQQNHSKKKRIVIEHTICRLKKYWIMSDVFRNRLRKYNRISDIVAGLINYRLWINIVKTNKVIL